MAKRTIFGLVKNGKLVLCYIKGGLVYRASDNLCSGRPLAWHLANGCNLA